MVSDVTLGSALTQSQRSDAAEASLASDFSQFLTLLTTQLQNQDPLSPVETTEFTNQLVAFTGVEQQINTNQRLDSLVALNIGSSFSSSQSYVGQDISYIGSEFEYTGAPSSIDYSLPTQAADVTINVLNELGEVVYTEDGSTNVGINEFVWNGQLNSGGVALPGTYEVQVGALDVDDNPIQTQTVVRGRVRGTESQNGQIFLLVGERAVPLSNVLNTSETASASASDALTSALNFVGLDVSFLNDEVSFDGETSGDILYDLAEDADRAQIVIRNDVGETIFTQGLDESDISEGRHLFRWDGRLNDGTRAPAGVYQFEVDAINSNDQRILSTSVAEGNVDGVETQNGQIFLDIGNRTISLNNILSANVPPPPV